MSYKIALIDPAYTPIDPFFDQYTDWPVKYPAPLPEIPVMYPHDQYQDNPVPYPPNTKIIDPPMILQDLQQYVYSGAIKSSATGEPIPRATVQLKNGGQVLMTVSADDNGYFQAGSNLPAATIDISSAGYVPWSWPASTFQHTFELEPDIIKLPPVLLPPGGKSSGGLLLLALLALVASQHKSG